MGKLTRAWSFATVAVVAVACSGGDDVANDGNDAPPTEAAGAQASEQPLVSDWSHQHVVFSQALDALSAEEVQSLQKEPRYGMQVLRRSPGRRIYTAPQSENANENFSDLKPGHRFRQHGAKRDWGQSLGANGSTGAPLNTGSWWPVYPAEFTSNSNGNPDCTKDYVVFPTNLAGAAGQASIVAYSKLYSGSGASYCNSVNPSVDWSYNTNFDASGTASNGTVQTSPVLSLDGSKVAFMETRGAGALLHLLKWHAGDGGAINSPATPAIATTWTPDGVAGDCPVTGSCLISIAIHGAKPDTGSSPFYDYQRDALYVGDDNGTLHKIINAFGVAGATPSEVLTAPWPIVVDLSTMLTSPTLDSTSGNIFTEDSSGRLAYVRESFSTAGTCTTGSPPCLGSTNFTPPSVHVVPDAPIVDSVTGKVFVFFGNNGGAPNTAVLQSDVTVSATVQASLGTGTGHHIHSGSFDNTYMSGNGSTGFLYMCGSSNNSTPTIRRVGFTNSGGPFANPVGTMKSTVDSVFLAVATASAECSPVTELFNANAPLASQDQIFFGVQNLGAGSSCGGTGCVMSINVTNTPATLTIANSIAVINGPSGIVVDDGANTTTYAQSSSLYFSSQGNSTGTQPCNSTTGVGCAIKVTQAGLQ